MKRAIEVIAVIALALAGVAWGQEVKPALPNDQWASPLSSEHLFASQIHLWRTVIYSIPKDGNILMEFSDDHGKLVFTVFSDGSVKSQSGADLGKITREFWKSMADAFGSWKPSACRTKPNAEDLDSLLQYYSDLKAKCDAMTPPYHYTAPVKPALGRK